MRQCALFLLISMDFLCVCILNKPNTHENPSGQIYPMSKISTALYLTKVPEVSVTAETFITKPKASFST